MAKSYIVGVDVGGTFTDAFGMSSDGHVASAKVLSTPPDYSIGILDSLEELASNFRLTLKQLLSDVSFLMHGTTVTLNAVVSGKTPKIGFITTKGHRDALHIMRMTGRYAGLTQEKIQDFTRTNKPPPLVPKDLSKEVTERIDYSGRVIVPLNAEEAKERIRELLLEKVEAVAVSLLWSFKNPVHETTIRSLIEQQNPSTFVTLSSELNPRTGEYARSSTTAFNCLIAPILRNYLDLLSKKLKERGFGGPILVMQGNGGVIEASVAPKYAVTTLGSVLVGGVVGATVLGQILGDTDIITTDVGGTTFLVGLVKDGAPVFTSSVYVNQHTLNLSMVNIATIGSGGGSIAWIDEKTNFLRVGPKSAGAAPGPACYNLGGNEPTVTDAAVVLGIIDPKFFMGGNMALDRQKAERAISARIAQPLGLTVQQAAAAIFEIQNSQTSDLVRKTTIEAGYDPRDFSLYVFGGAGPMHCFAYARELGVKKILIPLNATASTFSAFGLASSDVIQSVEKSDPAIFPVDASRMTRNFHELEEMARKRLLEQKINLPTYDFRREIDLKYRMQNNEITLNVKGGELGDNDVDLIMHDFQLRYEQLYGKGSGSPESPVEFVNYRVFTIAHLPMKPRLPLVDKSSSPSPVEALIGKRSVSLDISGESKMVSIYDSRKLKSGHEILGPAIIQVPTTTVVVPEKGLAEIDEYGNAQLNYI